MGKAATKYHKLFEKESALLKHTEEFINSNNGLDPNAVQKELITLSKSYKDLLNQQILITKVSDRLQKKLDKTNLALEEKNVQLENYIDALTQARIGRRAATITLVIAIALFILTEALIEPQIDRYFLQNYEANVAIYASLGLKALIALIIRPIEKIVEVALTNKARKNHQEATAASMEEGYAH